MVVYDMVDHWNHMDALDFENDPCGFDLRNDHGGSGWCANSGSDSKCNLDEGIVNLLVTLGYEVPATRKLEDFFMLCMGDPEIQDLTLEERVKLVTKTSIWLVMMLKRTVVLLTLLVGLLTTSSKEVLVGACGMMMMVTVAVCAGAILVIVVFALMRVLSTFLGLGIGAILGIHSAGITVHGHMFMTSCLTA